MESKQRKRKHDSQDANPDVEFFQKHGYVIIRNVWTTKQTGLFSKHAEETIKHYLQQGNNLPQQSVVNRGRNRIDIQVSNKWPLCKTKRFCFPSKITSILQQLLGSHFQIQTQNLIISLPGSDDQMWHTDVVPLFEEERDRSEKGESQEGPEEKKERNNKIKNYFYITMWSPLINMSEELGPVEIESTFNKDKVLLSNINSTDVVLFDGLTLHRGRANVSSDTIRPVYYTAYSRPWYKDPNIHPDCGSGPDSSRTFGQFK